ncbi:uncharacterized protein FPRO_12395 [Fusarium proliferatum ET1]|uniref:Uncharacterized protein n=1 Tax=Fusarium proliferatum (strain ET1) TaxID=1227346 RepID=A0A1L7W8Q0_FUSPR|nr:uncharacterized protein FPRO_12395 [Fusarium proliferatum ET1]CZR48955.1 uncharacterized protein FPRO_12395 [Fusarium proliferatum ET1]
MVTEIFRATYTEQDTIEKFLNNVFGEGNATVQWKQGKYNRTLLRHLTEAEKKTMQESLNVEHHEETKDGGTG